MNGYLVLENDESFQGVWKGAVPETPIEGEVVFFTGMTGYQEVLTDPSFKGQIVVLTYPLIGNYGINDFDFESSEPQVTAVVICECSEQGYHYESKKTFSQYLQKWNIPVLSGVDTRAVVKRIREQGVMGGLLVKDIADVQFEHYQTIEEKNLIPQVSVTKAQTFGEGHFHVVLMDFGYKKSIVDSLVSVGCKVTIVPYNTTFQEVCQLNPDGVMFSNGPGDPKQMSFHLSEIKKMAQHYPTLAICLGHQLLSLAFGGETEKLKFGHRGSNQPVIDIDSRKVFMTSQNHTFVVQENSLENTNFTVRYRNVNDGSVEGMNHAKYPITSVQFHPEAHPGPVDSVSLFHEFVTSMQSVRREEVYA
ncbi:carbamoyl phosphate synthase small subunit [Bacillus solimangrovi]|uniref:Carbamoyl phosphate synthase small chain n=1 Tax=Bacillus solimangrovi TaxID=1305675 RepID=A0A1E5LC42_9BACI|nr:carbamoyl phosphate synthase small subunit [Bacillus solimangrovi]OEH91641.1 carbamoyl phosphate synthase small subunit [Bacillus solimangrovi]